MTLWPFLAFFGLKLTAFRSNSGADGFRPRVTPLSSGLTFLPWYSSTSPLSIIHFSRSFGRPLFRSILSIFSGSE